MTRRELLATPALLVRGGASGTEDRPRIERRAGERVSFFWGKRLVSEYCFSSAAPKPYIHPLLAPNGAVLSYDGPKDHPHHHGLMLAWSGVNGFDFWGKVNPAPHGRIVHQRFETARQSSPAAAPKCCCARAASWLLNTRVRPVRNRLKSTRPSAARNTAGNHPPAEPGAFGCEPLKAAIRGR